MRRKALFMETTNISALQTVAQIQTILGAAGAQAVMTEYEDGDVSALSFRISVKGNETPFRLPCRHHAILDILLKRKKRGTHNDRVLEGMCAQAKRVAWRQVYRWVEAQLALVQTDMVTIQEVFLPYLQTGKDQTLYQLLEKTEFKVRQLEHQP